MMPIRFKNGIRVEKYRSGVFFGLGVTWFTEYALQIDLLFWSITIGRVYDMDS